MSATSASALTAAKGMITRLWPNRSTRRPDRGAAMAKATLQTPATAPAIAYDPVRPCTSRTTPDAEHGHWHPPDEPGEHESFDAGPVEQPPVRPDHPRLSLR